MRDLRVGTLWLALLVLGDARELAKDDDFRLVEIEADIDAWRAAIVTPGRRGEVTVGEAGASGMVSESGPSEVVDSSGDEAAGDKGCLGAVLGDSGGKECLVEDDGCCGFFSFSNTAWNLE